jgi:hypothetical protein
MERLLFGFRHHMIPIPWSLFMRLAPRDAAKNSQHLDDDHRRVHHFVVRELPGFGRPMGPDYVARELGMETDQVAAIMDELEQRKLFLFRPGGRDVVWAYPVTVEPTPHRVTFSSGESIFAA